MAIKAMEKIIDINSEDYYFEKRYVLVDTETGEIVDDAQGYGYRTAYGAHKAYGWKQKHRKVS